MKHTKKSAAGTSFHNTTIWATPYILKIMLGEPTYSQNDGYDKVNYSWNMETTDGDVFTVYDWKEYKPLIDDEMYCFHIGGKSKNITDIACNEIIDLSEQMCKEIITFVNHEQGGLSGYMLTNKHTYRCEMP